MRVLLDTNVLIAAFVARGLCHELVEHCQREHLMVSSDRLLSEFERKLQEKFRVPAEKAAEAVSLVRDQSEIVTPKPLRKPVCRDPDDDWVLATAREGACECIVTGDKDLLDLKTFRGIPIVAPRTFWALEASRRPPA